MIHVVAIITTRTGRRPEVLETFRALLAAVRTEQAASGSSSGSACMC